MSVRLDKFLCECNVGTRSEVKKIIKSKKVLVNGEVVTKPEFKIDEEKSEVICNGKEMNYEKFSYYLFHKPMGCVTANVDNLHKTVMDYLPQDLRKGFSPVGRLDLDTEGLLLITNDGELNHHLLSPSHHIMKTYYAILDSEIKDNVIELFSNGIDIGDDKPTLPAELNIIKQEIFYNGNVCYQAELTISEGRFHQVKRMFKAVGAEVVYLKRIKMGNLSLGKLEKGEFRKLTKDEINQLKLS